MAFLATPLAAAIIGGIGTGVSVIGGLQQAKAAEGVASANAAIQRENAATQAATLRAQAAIQQAQAAQNLKLRQGEAAGKFANATTIANQARAQDDINASNLRLEREKGARLMATQKAKYAAAGIVESTGSPLSLLAETAGIITRDQKETQYAMELHQNGLYHEAALERLGGEYALAGATLDYGSEMSASRLREASAAATLLTGNRQADVTEMAGSAQASGYRYGALGNLFTGAASGVNQYIQLKALMPKTR